MDPFDLNWRHLRALVAIAERRSLSAAADAVHLSQPALTKGLAKIERATATILFERRSDGLVVTDAGNVIVERIGRAADLLAAAVAAITPRGGYKGADQHVTRTQLRAALALANAGSFVGAGAATGLSEPALHRAIRELEQVIGVVLVERRGRGVQITAKGRRLVRGIRLAAREIAAGLAEATRDQAALGPMLVGAMPLARARILPLAVAALQRQDFAVEVRIVEGSWNELVDPLRDGSLDLMIGALRDRVSPDLVQTPLFDDRLVVVGRAGHPLATREPDVEALASYPWVIGAPGTPLRSQWEHLFRSREPPPAPVACGSTVAIRRILAHSDLLTLLSPDQIDVEIAAGLLTTIGAPLASGSRRIGIVTREGWRPTAPQRRLLDLLHREADARLQENA